VLGEGLQTIPVIVRVTPVAIGLKTNVTVVPLLATEGVTEGLGITGAEVSIEKVLVETGLVFPAASVAVTLIVFVPTGAV
jgi:hypothetical protein